MFGRIKRTLSFMMIVCILFTSIPVYATETEKNENTGMEITEISEEEIGETEDFLTENTEYEDTESETEIVLETEKVSEDEAVTEDVFADEANSTEEEDLSTVAQGMEKIATVDKSDEWDISTQELAYKNKKVLLIQDNVPWTNSSYDLDSNQDVLKNLAAYDVTTTEKFPKLNISDYSVIIMANDQDYTTYANYARFMDKMEEFASNGGVIVFGAADGGWAGGYIEGELPGGVTKTSRYTYYNEIVYDKHPIVTGELTGGDPLVNSDLYNNYCSHVYFNEESFPLGTRVILKEENGYPTLIEYPLGRGRVIASGLTWEHCYRLQYGEFGRKALDDLYSYALYISGISSDNLDLLLDATIEDDQHLVVAADAKTQEPIENAEITLDGKKIVSDRNGRAWFDGISKGKKTLKISADGYQTKYFYYNVSGGDMKYVFLTKNTSSTAYLSGASAEVKKYDGNGNLVSTEKIDLLEDNLSINTGKKYVYTITLKGEWNGQKAGNYCLYLNDQYAYSTDGVFKIREGKCSNSKGEEISFGDGVLHARMIAADGSRSESIELNLFSKKKSSGSLFGSDNNGKFSFGGSDGIKFTVPDKYPVIGNTDFNFSMGELPMTWEINDDEIKIAIGFTDFKNLQGPKDAWSEYVKQYEIVKRTKNLQTMMKKYGGKSGALTVKKGWDTDFSIVGYASGKYDPDTGEVTELTGELMVSGGGDYKYNQQFIVGAVPLYFEIGGGLKLSSASKVHGIMAESGQMIIDNNLTFTPKFTIGGGVGINGALSVGAEGEASLPIVICDQKGNVTDGTIDYFSNISLAGEMNLTASLLFVFNAKKSIAKGEWQLARYWWDTGKFEFLENVDLEAQMAAIDILNQNEYTLMERSYLENAGEWYTNELQTQALQNGMTILQTGIMPTSAPEIIKLNEDMALMVFQQDIAERSSINRSCLMYSVYSNGVWSEPKAVWDNGTADMTASLVTGEAGTYVVWQKLNKELDDASDVDMMAASCEIAVAKFNVETQTFEDAKYLTEDDVIQMIPTAAGGEDSAYAIYVENDSNELLGGGTNTVTAVSLNREESIQLYSGNAYVTGIDAIVRDGVLEAAIILDADADMNTVSDTEIYIYKKQQLQRLTDDECAQLNAHYSNDVLYWYEDSTSTVCSYDGENVKLLVDGTNEIGTNIKVIENAGKTAITWIGVNKENQHCIYAKILQNGMWSDAVEIVASEDSIMQYDGFIDADGNWNLAATAKNEEDLPVLAYTGVKPVIKTKVENLVATDRGSNDHYYKLSMDFTNESEQTIDSLNIEFLNDAGEVVYSEVQMHTIAGGRAEKLQLEVALPIQSALNEYTVRVYPEGEEDLTDNEGVVALGYSDIVLSIDNTEKNNVNVLTVSIFNDSDVKNDVVFTIRENDPENGILVDIVKIDDLESGETQIYSYTYDLNRMDFGDNPSKTYYYQVTSTKEESYLDNNYAQIVFENPFYSENGEMIPPEAITVNAPDPVKLNVDTNTTYELETVFTPFSASKWPLVYTSSDETVVVIEDGGVIRAVGEGNAVVTIGAANTDLTEEVNVKVAGPESSKLRIEMTELSVPTTSYQIGDVWQMDVYGNKSAEKLESGMFKFKSSDDRIASVDENGVVTMLSPGKVTLTAEYSKKPSLKAVLKITVEKEKVGSIELSYLLDGYIRSSSTISDTPEYFKTRTITLLPNLIAEDESILDAENVKITYTSSNKNVAVVNKNGEVSGTGKVGTAVIMATVEGSEAAAAITVYCYNNDYQPVLLGSEKIRINAYSMEGTEVVLQPVGETYISSYTSQLYKKDKNGNYTRNYDFYVDSMDEENGSAVFNITASNTAVSGNYYLRTYISGKYYYTKLVISIKNSLPSVNVKAESFNVFYNGAKGKINIITDSVVNSVSIEENKNSKKLSYGYSYSIDYDTNEYYIYASGTLLNGLNNGKSLNSYNKSYTVQVYLEGYDQPVEKKITIPSTYKQPKVTLTDKIFYAKKNEYIYANTTLKIDGNPDLSDTYIYSSGVFAYSSDTENGCITIGIPSASKDYKGTIEVQQNEWAVDVKIPVIVKAEKKAAKFKLSKTAVVDINKQLGDQVQLCQGTQKLALADTTLISDEMFVIRSGNQGITVIPIADASNYDKSQYTYKLNLYGANSNSYGEVTLKIKCQNVEPSVSTSEKTLYLDGKKRGRIVDTTVLVNKKEIAFFNMSGMTIEKVNVAVETSQKGCSKNDISAKVNMETGKLEITTQQITKGKYTVTLQPVLSNGKMLKTAKVSVIVGDNTAIVASASGTMDALKRAETTAKVSFTLKNNSAKISSVSIKDSYKSSFEITASDLTAKKAYITIGIKEGADVLKGTQKIDLTVKLSDGSSVNASVKTKVTSASPKISCGNVVLSRENDEMVRNVKLTLTPSADYVKEVVQLTGENLFRLSYDEETGIMRVAAVNKAKLKKSSYTVEYRAKTHNEAVNSVDRKYKLTITIK